MRHNGLVIEGRPLYHEACCAVLSDLPTLHRCERTSEVAGRAQPAHAADRSTGSLRTAVARPLIGIWLGVTAAQPWTDFTALR